MDTQNIKFPKSKPEIAKICPRCAGSDVMIIPGNPTYYYCKDKNCPSHLKDKKRPRKGKN